MSAKQARLEKIKKENRKLEAERDGLRQVRNWAVTILWVGPATVAERISGRTRGVDV